MNSILENSNFLRRIALDVQILMSKRLAHINSDGHPPEWLLNHPCHLYVLGASSKTHKVSNSIEHAKSIIRQIEISPPEEWLKRIGISKQEFIQQNVDLFSVVLFSSLDRSLLLANFLMDLGKNEKEVTYKKVIARIKEKNSEIAELLTELYEETENLAEYRNHFSHRGLNRNSGRFSSVYRVKVITRTFNIPMENVRLLENEAEGELGEMLRKEVSNIELIITRYLELISAYYTEGLGRLGGIDMPNENELNKAKLVREYFSGGNKPDFMA